MCINYSALNANTIIDFYPIPRIDNILNQLGGSVIFSKIDLAQGHHQFGQPRVMSIELHFRCTLDSLSIVLFCSVCVMGPQYSKGSYIRYFKLICMFFALCTQMIFSSYHGLLLYMNNTFAGFCSNYKPLACMPK